MARTIRRSAESWTYILLADRGLPVAEQTVFTLRPLTAADRAAFHDEIETEHTLPGGDTIVPNRVRRTALRIAVQQIERVANYPIGAPEAWPDGDDARARYLDQLPDADVLELGNEVWARGQLGIDRDAVGKSSPPGHTPASGGD
jgi:hypothetical protein